MDVLEFIETDAVGSHKIDDDWYSVTLRRDQLLNAFNELIRSMRDNEEIKKFYDGDWRKIRTLMTKI